VNDQAEPGNYPLRPIGIGAILVIVGFGLVIADLVEFTAINSHRPLIPYMYVTHWTGEFLVLLLVFSFLYFPLKNRRKQRNELLQALKVSENQYRTLVEGLDAGIALIDDQNQLIKCNQAMEKFMGDPACKVSKRKCYELLLYPGGEVCEPCPGAKTLASGKPEVVELIIPESSGRLPNVVRVSTFPVYVAAGEVHQFIEVVEDVSEEKKAAAEIQRLTRELNSAAENERKRLARDLHDQCGQVLAGVQYSLEALRTEVAQTLPETSQHFDTISDLVEQIGHNIREVSTQLHPSVLDDLGLQPTLKWLVDGAQRQRPDIEFILKVDPIPDSLAADFYTTIYRVCQESLNNVSKHSKASKVEISLVSDGESAILRVQDNGCGFHSEQMMSQALPVHIGLHGMRERVQSMGGAFIVKSYPDAGALVEARLPFTMEN